MIKQQRIICDLDDTLWDMVPTWCEQYSIITDDKEIINPSHFYSWDIVDIVGEYKAKMFYDILTNDEFWDEVVENQDRVIINRTYELLVKLIQKYDFYITTATSYKSKHKLDLFFKLFDCIPQDKIILIKDKWLVDTDIIIDDNPEILSKCQKLGRRCVKINKPWNQDIKCESYSHFIFAAEKLVSEV